MQLSLRTTIAAASTFMLAAASTVLAQSTPPPPAAAAVVAVPAGPPLSAALKPRAILAAMERVADWQLAHPSRHKTTDWTQGALYAGLMALAGLPESHRVVWAPEIGVRAGMMTPAGVSESPRYLNAMMQMGASNQWQLGPRKFHADDHCVGQTYVELSLRKNDKSLLKPMQQQFDDILAHPTTTTSLDFTQLPKGKASELWAWCDALFMGPPAWVRLASVTGDARYRNFAITNWWLTSDYLYDQDEHLYFRDSTYFKKREANGQKVFWSRGNGWVMGGLVRTLQFLPKNDPARAKLIQQFQEMAAKILTCQQPDGLWRASLLDPDSYPLQETSGSGFYTYALAWGVNQGLLERAKFEPAVAKAWAALVACVAPDGKLTHVQPIGADPKKFDAGATEAYGVGAFLLAGSEVYQLIRGPAKTL